MGIDRELNDDPIFGDHGPKQYIPPPPPPPPVNPADRALMEYVAAKHSQEKAMKDASPIRAPYGHLWLNGRCECGTEYDLQTWASHVELVRQRDLEDFIARWRPRIGGFIAGVMFLSIVEVVRYVF